MTDAPAATEKAAAIDWHAVSVRYPYAEQTAVGAISLTLRRGERLLILGPSGCGKSTLLNTVTGIVPATIPAELNGEVLTLGVQVASRSPAEWAAFVAQLFQDADQTLCGMTVCDEIAFALENRALPHDEINRRVQRAMDRAGVPADWLDRRTATLSGGEKQIVALAAALAQEAEIFIADEPTAHLAPDAAARLHAAVEEEGRTALIVDHRLDGLIGGIDRVAVLGRNGLLLASGPPREIFRRYGDQLAQEGIWRPLACDLDRALAHAGIFLPRPPLTVEEVVAELESPSSDGHCAAHAVISEFIEARCAVPPPESGAEVASLANADCAPLFARPVVRNVSLAVRAGEAIAILGRNGAGKSTLGASLAGLLRLKAGTRSGPAGGFAFQRPETQFTEASARGELASVVGDDDDAIARILDAWRLADVAGQHPYELSQGQKRRLALAALTADKRWPMLVLDEPTAGLDSAATGELAGRITALSQAGRAVVVITHDLDFALRCCTRGVVVEGGGIVADAPIRQIARNDALLAGAGLAPPELARLMKWLDAPPC